MTPFTAIRTFCCPGPVMGNPGCGRRSLRVPGISGHTGRIFHLFLHKAKVPSTAMTRGSWDAQVMLGVGQDWHNLCTGICCGFWELLCSHTGCRLPVLHTSALGDSPTPCQAGLRFHLLSRQNKQADALFNLGVREDIYFAATGSRTDAELLLPDLANLQRIAWNLK